MLRLVGIQRHTDPSQEFLLLQNQGHMRLTLRGHVVMSDSALLDGDLGCCAHLFREEESIGPGLFVLLSTGSGTPHWTKTKDGAHVFRVYMARDGAVWNHCKCPLHVMSAQHSYVARSEALALR